MIYLFFGELAMVYGRYLLCSGQKSKDGRQDWLAVLQLQKRLVTLSEQPWTVVLIPSLHLFIKTVVSGHHLRPE